ncbi:MAG: hypothetical protein V3U20_04490 [Thermoplasmata archaeon]
MSINVNNAVELQLACVALHEMVLNMQNIWLVGILLAGLVGSGAAMGYGIMNHDEGMHHMMQGEHFEDCHEHEDCEYEHEECQEHSEEECIKEHEDCDMDEHMKDYGCER